MSQSDGTSGRDGEEARIRAAQAWLPPPPIPNPGGVNAGPPTWNPIPRRAREWLAFVVSAFLGIAVWIPTNWAQPRYSNNGQQGSSWYFVLMPAAAVLLGVVFAESWRVAAAGLVLPQLLVAPWTTPRGDNDGLWVLILPMLFVVAAGLHFVAWFSASARRSLASRRSMTN